MKATIGDAIGINGGSDEIDLLSRRIDALNKRMMSMVNETIQSGLDTSPGFIKSAMLLLQFL